MATLDGLSVLFCADLPAPKEDEPPKLDMRRGLFDGHETGDNDDSEEPQNDEWEDEDDHQE
ncbi:MAG: hypothetical protein ACKV0T_00855 [Planctomycetales bacterium]